MPNAEPSPSTLRTPEARCPQDMTMSSTPCSRSQSSMKTTNGRSTSGTTGLGTVVVRGRRRVPSPPARIRACTRLGPADGAGGLRLRGRGARPRGPADALIGEPRIVHAVGIEEVAPVDQQVAAHRGRQLAQIELAELLPLR